MKPDNHARLLRAYLANLDDAIRYAERGAADNDGELRADDCRYFKGLEQEVMKFAQNSKDPDLFYAFAAAIEDRDWNEVLRLKSLVRGQVKSVNSTYPWPGEEERDTFIWKNIVGSSVTQLKLELEAKNFSQITTAKGFKDAALRFAKHHRLSVTRNFKEERPMTDREKSSK